LKFTYVLYRAARGADVIYAQNAVAAGLPAVIVGMLRRVPVVIKFAGDEAWERATQLRQTSRPLEAFLATPEGSHKIKNIRRLQGFILRRARRVVASSRYLAQVVERHYRVPPDQIIANYDPAEKKQQLPFDVQSCPYQIVVTARLVEWKGVAGVLRAVAILKRTYPDIKLVIAGDGPEEAPLKTLAAELDIDRHIVFLGRVSRAETWYLRAQSTVYVLNSTSEGPPHTLTRSLVAGIPVVATHIPGIDEIIRHEETGLLVSSGDHQALVSAITRLFTSQSLREQLVASGYELIQKQFSWDAHLHTLQEILESVRAKPLH
jgi:1,4-alpha-glucan branching enzyme